MITFYSLFNGIVDLEYETVDRYLWPNLYFDWDTWAF